MKRLVLLLEAVVFASLIFQASGQQIPAPPAIEVDDGSGVTVHAAVGGAVGMTGATTGVTPFVYLNIDAPVADSEYAPHLIVNPVLNAEPGESTSSLDPSTWKALEFGMIIAQPVSTKVKFDLYGEFGFATKLPGSEAPLVKTARWVYGGVRFRSSRGLLAVGVGADQRLNGLFRPSINVTGSVALYTARNEQREAKARILLVGSAVLGFDAQTSAERFRTAVHDVVRIGIAVGI